MNKIIKWFKGLFMKKTKSTETTNLDRGFHPDILFIINRPYAEYVDFEEIN